MRNTIPKVSAIIATYNRGHIIDRAINSVLRQTYTDFELIVVDDGSLDNTAVRMEKYADDPRVIFLQNDSNLGNTTSYNRGVAQARGEYLAFLDDDDEWLPRALDQLTNAMDNASSKVGLVHGWCNIFSGEKLVETRRDNSSGDIYEQALSFRVPTLTSVYLARASAVRESGGFDNRYSRATDILFVRDLVVKGYHIQHVPHVTAFKHDDGDQKSNPTEKNTSDLCATMLGHLDDFASELEARPKVRAKIIMRLAQLERAHGNSIWIKHFVQALFGKPRYFLSVLATSYKVNAIIRFISRNNNITRGGMKAPPFPCIWLTGLSGAGKTTIASTLQKRLDCYVIDGDELRTGLNNDLGFTPDARTENVRRVAHVARIISDTGVLPVVSCISPMRDGRDYARDLFQGGQFIEVHVSTPIDICIGRDPKGLYQRARNGEVTNIAGMDAPYESPLYPEVIIHPNEPVNDAVDKIIATYEVFMSYTWYDRERQRDRNK